MRGSSYRRCLGSVTVQQWITVTTRSDGLFTTLYNFDKADGYPYAGLVLGTDGNFYGTTSGNTIFRITPQGELTVLYTFCLQPGCPDGEAPLAGLVRGKDGNFYGTTTEGGTDNGGTVFKITPAGQLTTLYEFGYFAFASGTLIHATDGNLYGTTSRGGDGTIFQITPDGSLTTLYEFNGSDGAYPAGGLLQDTNGIFYGTTSEGGKFNAGTVFSLSIGLSPFVSFVRDPARVGQRFGILGQGLTGTTAVSLNGTSASFTVKSDTFILANVPSGATTGYVTVTTPGGTLTSNKPFVVIP